MSRRNVQDLLLASGGGALIAVSPLTPPSLLPSAGIGAIVAAGIYVWRSRRAPAIEAEAVGPSVSVPPLVIAALVGIVAVFFPTFQWLYDHWTGSVWTNDHGIFIPPLVAYMIWRTLKADPRPERAESSMLGLVWIGLGLALAVIDVAVETRYLSVLGFLIVLPGLSLVTLGARRTRALTVPLAVSWLMMPIPRTFASDLYLRDVTAQGVEPIIRALGYTVLRDGTVLEMASGVFIVSNACSGFATMYASIAVALILSAFANRHRDRAILLLSAIPLALAANTLRVVLLVLLTTWWGQWVIDSKLHEGSGVVTFVLVLVILFGISDRLGSQLREEPS